MEGMETIGLFVGSSEGGWVGADVGEVVGAFEGTETIGLFVGSSEGAGVGANEGEVVGQDVGDIVGVFVGASWQYSSCPPHGEMPFQEYVTEPAASVIA